MARRLARGSLGTPNGVRQFDVAVRAFFSENLQDIVVIFSATIFRVPALHDPLVRVIPV